MSIRVSPYCGWYMRQAYTTRSVFKQEEVMKKKKEIVSEPKYLLEGKAWTPAVKTDISQIFRKYGWVPPSEVKNDRNV